jgi:hypothetical protein
VLVALGVKVGVRAGAGVSDGVGDGTSSVVGAAGDEVGAVGVEQLLAKSRNRSAQLRFIG